VTLPSHHARPAPKAGSPDGVSYPYGQVASKSLALAFPRMYTPRRMDDDDSNPATEGRPARFSYLFMAGNLVLIGGFRLATPLLAAFFAYLALTKLHFVRRGGKALAVGLFLILVSAISYGLGHFINDTVRALPEIADNANPSVIQWAREYQLEPPSSDYGYRLHHPLCRSGRAALRGGGDRGDGPLRADPGHRHPVQASAGISPTGCWPKWTNFSRMVVRVTPSQRAALAWLPLAN
jgi:hypothetical protein